MPLEKTEKNLLKLLDKKPSFAFLKIPNGTTFLHIAAAEGWALGVKRLLGLGADPFRANNEQKTPHDLAIAAGHHIIAQELLSHHNNLSRELYSARNPLTKEKKYLLDFSGGLRDDPLSTNEITNQYRDDFLSEITVDYSDKVSNVDRAANNMTNPIIMKERLAKRNDHYGSPESISSQEQNRTNPHSPNAEAAAEKKIPFLKITHQEIDQERPPKQAKKRKREEIAKSSLDTKPLKKRGHRFQEKRGTYTKKSVPQILSKSEKISTKTNHGLLAEIERIKKYLLQNPKESLYQQGQSSSPTIKEARRLRKKITDYFLSLKKKAKELGLKITPEPCKEISEKNSLFFKDPTSSNSSAKSSQSKSWKPYL